MTEPRLLGIHGLNDSSSTWAPLTSCGLEIHGFDMPWRSISFVSAGYRSFKDLINPFEAACADLAGEQFGVIAHSLGASMVLQYLARTRTPGPIRFLILMCPTYVQLKEVGVVSTRRLHQRHFDEVFAEGIHLSSSGRDLELTLQMTKILVRAISDSERRAVLQLVEHTSLSPLESVDLPVLIIAGSRDQGLGIDRRHELASRLPGSTLHVLEGHGHFGHAKAPSTIAPVVRSWLTRSVLPHPHVTTKGHA